MLSAAAAALRLARKTPARGFASLGGFGHTVEERSAGFYHLTFDRPEVHNAFNAEMIAALAETARALRRAAGLRALFVRGRGASFQADLRWSDRVGAVVRPMPRLFGVGFAAAALGYGLTDCLTRLRDLCGIAVVAPPRVPILGAAVYTGVFVAVVSNGSYQILQGLVERGWWGDRRALLFVGRAGRSLMASALAIRGMQLSGLQAVTVAPPPR